MNLPALLFTIIPEFNLESSELKSYIKKKKKKSKLYYTIVYVDKPQKVMIHV